MLFFIDTAKIEEIKMGLDFGLVDGVTTNPSLIAKMGKPYLPTIQEIARLVPGPVSGEVLATEYAGMMNEGRRLAALADNVVVKLPMSIDGLRAVRTLADEGIRSNVTLCFSSTQALLAAKAGAAYISPFVGRIDDLGQEGLQLVEDIIAIYDNYDYETQVLVASVRSPLHVEQAAKLGAQVATIPFKVLLQLHYHPLTDIGLESFLADWKKVGGSIDD